MNSVCCLDALCREFIGNFIVFDALVVFTELLREYISIGFHYHIFVLFIDIDKPASVGPSGLALGLEK